MANLYANENFPRQVVEELRRLKHDVLTTAEASNAGKSMTDEEVLAFAAQNRRAVITLDRRDFIRLHQNVTNHSGIIVCSQDSDTSRQAKRIHEKIRAHKSLVGQLVRVNRPEPAKVSGSQRKIQRIRR